jgi:hypothetical protein
VLDVVKEIGDRVSRPGFSEDGQLKIKKKKKRINNEGETKRKERNAYKARRCMNSITPGTHRTRAPSGSMPGRDEVSPRIWPIERVQS